MSKRRHEANQSSAKRNRTQPELLEYDFAEDDEILEEANVNTIDNKKDCYDVGVIGEDILEDEQSFIRNIPDCHKSNEHIPGENFKLVSHLDESYIFLSRNYDIKVDVLKKHFPNGHTLAIDLASSYFIPLAIDLDHEKCFKNHTCPVQMNYQIQFAKEIYLAIREYLKIPVSSADDSADCFQHDCLLAMKFDRSKNSYTCGMHLYFHRLKVSLIFYHHLLTFLALKFQTEGYTFDKTIRFLPLPLSTKKRGELYLPHDKIIGTGVVATKRSNKFFDFNYESRFHNGDFYKIATIQHKHMARNDDKWLILGEQDIEHLCIANDRNSLNTTGKIPPMLQRFQCRDVQSNIPNLLEYFRAINSAAIGIKTTIDETQHFSAEVINHIRQLGAVIADTMSIDCSDPGFRHIYHLMLCPNNSCGNAEYIIFALIKYLIAKVNHLTTSNCKAIIRKYIEHTRSDNVSADKVILFMMQRIEQIDSDNESMEVHGDYVSIFRYLTMMEYFGRDEGDCDHNIMLKSVVKKELVRNSTEEQINMVLERVIFPFLFPCINTSKCGSTFLLFDLIKFHSINLNSTRSNQGQYDILLKHLMFQHLIMALSNTLKDMDRKIICQLIVSAWTNYRQTIRSYDCVDFAKYRYCINTNFGYFSNITGMYMTKTPFYFFESGQMKSFATTPPVMNHTNCNLKANLSLIDRYDGCGKIIDVLFAGQHELLYYCCILPGLISLKDQIGLNYLYLEEIFSIIVQTSTDESVLNAHFKSLLYRYPLDLDAIITLAKMFQLIEERDKHVLHINETALYEIHSTRQNLKESIISAKRNPIFLVDFKQSSEVIISEILGNYALDIGKRHFFLAYIYSILVVNIRVRHDYFVVQILEVKQNSLTNYDGISINDFEKDFSPDENFIVGDRYDPKFYSVKNDYNLKRGLYLFYGYHVPSNISQTIATFLTMFRYNTDVIREFFQLHSLMYQPFNDCRKLIMYRGTTGSGKTITTNILSDMNKPSEFSIPTKISTSNGEGHSSVSILAQTSYFVVVREAHKLDAAMIKTYTGNDPIYQRKMYEELRKIVPISFIVLNCNDYPEVRACNAIRNRIEIFKFEQSFKDSSTISSEEQNELLLFCKNLAVSKILNITALSEGLSNILYCTFTKYRNEQGCIIPHVRNAKSTSEKINFMKFNNEMYKILDELNIAEGIGNSITSVKLLRDFRQFERGGEGAKNKTLTTTWKKFIAEFNETFASNAVRDQKGAIKSYSGVGNISPDNLFSDVFEIHHDPDSTIKMDELCEMIMSVTGNDGPKTRYIFDLFILKYSNFISDSETLKGLSIKII